ncbi:MAG: hypothetical protein ACE361_26575 [Aureliella sp.]
MDRVRLNAIWLLVAFLAFSGLAQICLADELRAAKVFGESNESSEAELEFQSESDDGR